MTTTAYVVGTMTLSGMVAADVAPALIPIGMVAGLSAVATLLLIVAVAGNKIQGIAMMRALGIVIAGLPCLPWFVDSPWNIAFGVLPRTGRPRPSGSPPTTAPGGPICSAVPSTTSRSPGHCSAGSSSKTREQVAIAAPTHSHPGV
jgi:hypothetical protein